MYNQDILIKEKRKLNKKLKLDYKRKHLIAKAIGCFFYLKSKLKIKKLEMKKLEMKKLEKLQVISQNISQNKVHTVSQNVQLSSYYYYYYHLPKAISKVFV